jgi:hypothetical protein
MQQSPPDRIVVSVVNASPVRTLLVTLFAPGELQTTYFLDRLGSDEWEFRQTNGSRRSVRFTPLSCIFEQAISNARSPCAVPPTIAGRIARLRYRHGFPKTLQDDNVRPLSSDQI